MTRMRSLLGVALAASLAAAPQAGVQASSSDSLAAQLKRCAALTDASPRLACYDALAGKAAASAAASPPAASPEAGGAVAATATPASAQAAAAATGAPAAPNLANFGVRNGPLQAERDPVREKTMLAVVSAVSTRGRGELVVTLDNGQVWRQIQPSEYPLKPGDRVEIDVAALGSYRLWTPSTRRATKVTRIQ